MCGNSWASSSLLTSGVLGMEFSSSELGKSVRPLLQHGPVATQTQWFSLRTKTAMAAPPGVRQGPQPRAGPTLGLVNWLTTLPAGSL